MKEEEEMREKVIKINIVKEIDDKTNKNPKNSSLRKDAIEIHNQKRKNINKNNDSINTKKAISIKSNDNIKLSENGSNSKNEIKIEKDNNSRKDLNLKKTINDNDYINENININEDKKKRKIYVDFNNLDKKNIINDEEKKIKNQQEKYSDNSIRTCQYTLISFFPLALINQFKTAFNWFFLIYIIIASIPSISNLALAPEITPFIIVLIISLIKEAIEDYRKYVNDKKSNNTPVLIFSKDKFHRDLCQNIRVGNIIKIYKDQMIPADILIIKSSFVSFNLFNNPSISSG